MQFFVEGITMQFSVQGGWSYLAGEDWSGLCTGSDIVNPTEDCIAILFTESYIVIPSTGDCIVIPSTKNCIVVHPLQGIAL